MAEETAKDTQDTTKDTPIVADVVVPAATVDDIKKAFPDASSDFIVSQLQRKATADQVKDAWIEQQAKELEEAKEEAKQAKTKKPGVEGLGNRRNKAEGSDYDGDGRADFDEVVRKRMAQSPGMDRIAAVVAVAREQPDLHEAFLLATNRGKTERELIKERFARAD